MRHRNIGKNSNLGFINRKRKDSSNSGYINHRIGIVEDFGHVGLVASESVQDYDRILVAKSPGRRKVKIFNLELAQGYFT